MGDPRADSLTGGTYPRADALAAERETAAGGRVAISKYGRPADNEFFAFLVAPQFHRVFRQIVSLNDPADGDGKVLGLIQTPGLFVELAHRELPACLLFPRVLPRHPIEPSFETTIEQEIVLVDR